MEQDELKKIFKKQMTALKKSTDKTLFYMVRSFVKHHENGASDVMVRVLKIKQNELSSFPSGLVYVETKDSIPLFDEKVSNDDSGN